MNFCPIKNDTMSIKHFLICLLFPFTLSAQVDEAVQDSLSEMELIADTTGLPAEESMEVYNETAPYTAPPLAPMAMREVPAGEWEKATDGLDYSKDVPKPPKEPKKSEPNEPARDFDWTGWTQGMGTIVQVLAVLFALCMLGYGIYWMLQTPRNRSIAHDGTEITLANLDEYIHETDLQRFLREALAAANWPLAVRLYFLQTIKSLSERSAIDWSREKTNRDYLKEMRQHPLSAQFRDVTRQYEQVWYGNQPISAEEFARLEPEFKALLEEIIQR